MGKFLETHDPLKMTHKEIKNLNRSITEYITGKILDQ